MSSNLVYVLQPVGAPSATAVVVLSCDDDFLQWESISRQCTDFFQKLQINISKIALLSYKEKGIQSYKFVQVRKTINGLLGFETSYDCGNSMIAAGYVSSLINGEKTLEIANIDTKLRFLLYINDDTIDLKMTNLLKNSIDSALWLTDYEHITVDCNNSKVKITLINSCNPYIIVDAKSLNVNSVEQLMKLNNNNNDEIIYALKSIRQRVIKDFSLNKDSEFPKIAIVYSGDVLAARTIYLNKWHDGLPITAIISILIATKIKKSVIYNLKKHKYILTAKGKKELNFIIDCKDRITNFELFNIKLSNAYTKYLIDSASPNTAYE